MKNLIMKKKRLVALAIAGALIVGNVSTAFAGIDHVNGGYWTDKGTLIWTYDDGSTLEIGRGTVFSDIHPDVTDPEYFLKEYYCYPGEADISYNSQGQLKTPYNNYMDEALPLLQEFVHSFDWIHADEATRYERVYARIANGQSGNTAGGKHTKERWQLLRIGLGYCEEFSTDFANLCKVVGIECVTYHPSVNHQDCLMKIGSQWLTVNPTDGTMAYSNSHLVPVDFDIEYHRWENEYKNSEEYKAGMDRAEAGRKARAGEITWTEYYQMVYPDKTVLEIEAILGMDMDSYAKLWE